MFSQGSWEVDLLGSRWTDSLQKRTWGSLLQLCGYRFVWHGRLSLGVLLVVASVFQVFLPVRYSFRHFTHGVKTVWCEEMGTHRSFLLAYYHMMCAWQIPEVTVCVMHHLPNVATQNLKGALSHSFPVSETWELARCMALAWSLSCGWNQDVIQGLVKGWEFTSEIAQPHVALTCDPEFLIGCWVGSFIPHDVDLSRGLPALLQLTVSDPKTEQRMCFEVCFRKSHVATFWLLLEANHLAFLEGKTHRAIEKSVGTFSSHHHLCKPWSPRLLAMSSEHAEDARACRATSVYLNFPCILMHVYHCWETRFPCTFQLAAERLYWEWHHTFWKLGIQAHLSCQLMLSSFFLF